MCPNVKPGERFDELALLRDVLGRIEGRRKPAIVRVPNDTAVAPDRLAELIERCVAAGIDGLKVAGGKPVAEPASAPDRERCMAAPSSSARSPTWSAPPDWRAAGLRSRAMSA
jgi:hypothetical protein